MEKKECFIWTEEKIRFMRDAYEQGGYQNVIAKHVAEYLSPKEEIVELGCGGGYLSLALSPYVKSVTANDQNGNVLEVLRENLQKNPGIKNVTILQGDARTLPESLIFDDMVCCYYGAIDEVIRFTAQHCRKGSVSVRKTWSRHRLNAGKTEKSGMIFASQLKILEERGIPYRSHTFQLEMGQPFRNAEDACAYFRLYGGPEAAPEQIREKLVTEGYPAISEEFPLYLPLPGEVGVFALNAEDCRRYEKEHPEK